MKSAVLIADLDSAIFAPMLVPERKSCLLRTNSFLSEHNHLYRFTILIAKAIAFSFSNIPAPCHRQPSNK